jgi:hypothetical protein
LWEGLELPGRPYDYHAAIQRVREMLWQRKLEEPDLLSAVESLAWLDIRLVLSHPHAVLVRTSEGGEHFYGMIAFDALIHIYRTEHFLREAAEVVEVGERRPWKAKALPE